MRAVVKDSGATVARSAVGLGEPDSVTVTDTGLEPAGAAVSTTVSVKVEVLGTLSPGAVHRLAGVSPHAGSAETARSWVVVATPALRRVTEAEVVSAPV